jgi:iron-sulfur cluster repair protein YtfE (RIC family)
MAMTSTDDPHDRLAALGRQLIATHAALLDALDRLHDGTLPPAELATHCAAFCAAVTTHHTGEDTTVFPALAARHPELRDVLAGLQHDHEMIAAILRRAAELAAALDAPGTRAELDGLAAILRSHFSWEERRLVAALDAVQSPELAGAVALPSGSA